MLGDSTGNVSLITLSGLSVVPLTPSGFAACLGSFYLFLFAFAKIAFTNYYYFVIAALCMAIAVASTDQVDAAPAAVETAKRTSVGV